LAGVAIVATVAIVAVVSIVKVVGLDRSMGEWRTMGTMVARGVYPPRNLYGQLLTPQLNQLRPRPTYINTPYSGPCQTCRDPTSDTNKQLGGE
jgi:hypothetical protein